MSAINCGCDPEYAWQGHLTGQFGYYCDEHCGTLHCDPKAEPVEVVTPSYVVGHPPIRTFESGATRNLDTSKFDYEAFINPAALAAYAEFMHGHRRQADGSLRDGDNWQKGITFTAYMKSLVRHTVDLWRMHRGYPVTNPDTGEPHTKQELCCAIVFNAMGYLKELVDTADINKGTT